jgi:cellulose synthase/poly-beta-1,6-N-acetylglucosamine synthase-like glycosyltransferase
VPWGELFLFVAAALLLVPAAVLMIETLVACWPGAVRGDPDAAAGTNDTEHAEPPRVVVLVPAHDEELQIEGTVAALRAQLPAGGRLVVIADNCGDRTAELAARAGATVIERDNRDEVGKGFAISFGLRQLDVDPPDVVILVDADCRVSAGGIALLARAAVRHQRPIQAEYLLTAPPRAGAMAVVSALAILLRNRVRPRGLARLGLPCHLTGSGMAFPWLVLRQAPETGANLVEDLVLGIELALHGHAARLCAGVQISSELPAGAAAGLGQRKRWEHGQLHTLRRYVPRLIGAGLVRRSADLIALGLDLLVPPLALLVFAQIIGLLITGTAAVVGWASAGPALAAGAAMALLVLAVALAWARFGRRTLPLRQLLFVPLYLLWKIPLYVRLLVHGKATRWERTRREPSGQ